MIRPTKNRRPRGSLLLLVLGFLCLPAIGQAQTERSASESRRQGNLRRPNSGDPLQSLLKFVRQEQEVEFAKPLPEFDATVRGAQEIEQRFQANYPSQKELAIYTLDWETSFAAAKQRAKKENRPIFFIVVTNYTGPTNFFSGHC